MQTTIETVHDGADLTIVVTNPDGVQAFFDRVENDQVLVTIGYAADDFGGRQVRFPIADLLLVAESLHYKDGDPDGYRS